MSQSVRPAAAFRLVTRATVPLSLLLASVAAGSPQAVALPTMPLAEVAKGMTGIGYTVVAGSEPETFGAEVLGVLFDAFPKHDLIIARLTGLDLERSGVIAGMSGSPVLVDGRVIGAVAYRLVSFGYEAIAGIIPIEQMLALNSSGVESPTSPSVAAAQIERLLQSAAAYATGFEPTTPMGAVGLAAMAGIEPIATPLSFNGFRPDLVRRVTPLFERLGYAPIAGGVAGGPQPVKANFVPGGALAVQLVRGDVSVTASGTITYRDGDRLLAFGHPFLQGGRVDFPFVAAEVITVLSSALSSSKLSVAGSEVRGAIREDRMAGILGILDAEPALVPVTVTIDADGPEPEVLQMEIVSDKLLTPLYLFLGIVNGVQSLHAAYGEATVELDAEIALGDESQPVRFGNLFSSANQAVIGLSSTLAGVFGYLYDNALGPVDVRKADITLRLRRDRRSATIERIWYERRPVHAGDLVQVALTLKPYQQPTVVRELEIRIPPGLSPGPLTVLVGSGDVIAQEEAAAVKGGEQRPTTLEQLVSQLNRRRRSDRLYVQLWRDRPGAIVDGRVMPGLPSSVRSILGSEQSRGDVTMVTRAAIAETFEQTDYVISGSQKITLAITNR